jgi:nucleoside-diphosphate-sugar epimerase
MIGQAVVIGGTGQVGRAIVSRLHGAGWTVLLVGRGTTPVPSEHAGLGFHRADRTDTATLAAVLGDQTRLLVDCACFTAVHARGLRELLPRVESTVMISSKAVYADDLGRHVNSADEPHFDAPIRESEPTVAPSDSDEWDSREGYGRCKVAAEQVLLDDGHPVTVLRPSKVHGAGATRPHEWVFVKRILDGRDVVLLAGRGRGADHPSGAENLAALVEAVAGKPGRRILNAADPDVPDGLAIARSIAAHFGHTWREVLLPDRLNTGAAASLGRHPWDRRPPIRLDMSAAAALGYSPVGSYAATIGPTLDWLAALARPGEHGHGLPDRFDVQSIERMLDYTAEDHYLRHSTPPER